MGKLKSLVNADAGPRSFQQRNSAQRSVVRARHVSWSSPFAHASLPVRGVKQKARPRRAVGSAAQERQRGSASHSSPPTVYKNGANYGRGLRFFRPRCARDAFSLRRSRRSLRCSWARAPLSQKPGKRGGSPEARGALSGAEQERTYARNNNVGCGLTTGITSKFLTGKIMPKAQDAVFVLFFCVCVTPLRATQAG